MPSAIARWHRVHLGIALATLVGVAAGYVAAVFYPGPFDMPAAAAPKVSAAPAFVPGVTRAQLSTQPSPPIPVVKPRVQSVSSFVDVTGNAASVNAVKLIARVEGYLEQLHYEDGQFVKKGDLLFTIQQDQCKDQLQQSQAQVLAAQASLSYAKTEVVRYTALLKKDAATQVEVDKWVYQRASAEAQLLGAQASVALAKLNLGYTEVRAPFDGIVGKHLIDPGNVVGGGGQQTALAEITQLDPIYVVANPDIADVQVKSPTLVYISAKAPGETVIYAVDAADSVLLNAPILVEHDLSRLRSSLRQLAPGERVSADSVDGNLVLNGVVSDAGKADKVRALAASIASEVKGSQVINRMTVATPNQVNLQVKISEVNVTKLNEIGVNWAKVGSELAFLTTNPVTLAAETTNTLRVGKLTGQAASALVSALEQEGFITALAEPNLTAMSGQTASFLAGGEFPVPISGSSASTGGFPTITVEFKSFGVSLAFTPTVIDANHLNLRVRPEISELSTIGEVSVPLTSTATVTIPALTVRTAETTVELGSGESFALAGLLQHTSTQLVSKVPWIGDIPILGALFRSDRFQRRETDLVVIVTPYLVNPVQTRLAAPTDGLQLPNDAQRVFLSDKYRQGLPGPARGPLNAGGRGLMGPGGFRLD